jgi:hypothetical protein
MILYRRDYTDFRIVAFFLCIVNDPSYNAINVAGKSRPINFDMIPQPWELLEERLVFPGLSWAKSPTISVTNTDILSPAFALSIAHSGRAERSIVQLGGNQEPTQKLLKRLTNLLATDARFYHRLY